MKKILLLILITFLITGCGTKKNIEYYENISDIIMSFNQNLNYDSKDILTNDKKIIDNYLESLKNMSSQINISQYIVHSELYKTDLPNSENVYIEDEICYINKANITYLENNGAGPNEPSVNLVCNGYSVDLYESDIEKTYSELTLTKKYGFRYLGYKNTESGYLFGYRSYYNGTTTTVELKIENENLKNIIVKDNQDITFE